MVRLAHHELKRTTAQLVAAPTTLQSIGARSREAGWSRKVAYVSLCFSDVKA